MRMTARDDHPRPTGADLVTDQLCLGDLALGVETPSSSSFCRRDGRVSHQKRPVQ